MALRDLDHFAGVAGVGVGPVGRAWLRLILFAHFGVARKPARVDQHPVARAEADRLAAVLGDHAHDPTAVFDQVDYRVLGPHVDPGLVRQHQHAALQRSAKAEDRLAPPLDHLHPEQKLQPLPHPRRGPRGEADRPGLVSRQRQDHWAQPQLVEQRTHRAGIEHRRADRPAARDPAHAVVVIVRPALGMQPLHAALFQPFEHRRAVAQVGFLALRRRARTRIVANRRVHISPRHLVAVLDPLALQQVVVGDPQDAAGHCRRTAELVGLFEDHRLLADRIEIERRGHRAAARTDDDKVGDCVKCAFVHLRHPLFGPIRENRPSPNYKGGRAPGIQAPCGNRRSNTPSAMRLRRISIAPPAIIQPRVRRRQYSTRLSRL